MVKNQFILNELFIIVKRKKISSFEYGNDIVSLNYITLNEEQKKINIKKSQCYSKWRGYISNCNIIQYFKGCNC